MTEPFDGSRLKALRLERAWSQEQLAAVSGLSARTVQRLEQGGKASLETLRALAAAFQLPIGAFQNGAAPGPEPTPTEATTMTDAALSFPPPPAPIADADNAKARFVHHLAIFALVMGGLTLFNLLRHPEHLWFVYPLLGWGIPLAWRGIKLFVPHPLR